MNESVLKACIKPKDLSLLYELLNDSHYEKYWPNVATAIVCTVVNHDCNDVSAVPTLLDYIRRNDCKYLTDVTMRRKINCITLLGRIGGPAVKESLSQVMFESGANEIARKWIDSQKVAELWPSRERAIARIQEAAIRGLIHLQDPQCNAMIDTLYDSELAKCKTTDVKTELFGELTWLMGARDYITDHSLEEYLDMQEVGCLTTYMMTIGPYTNKYRYETSDEKVRNQKLREQSELLEKAKKHTLIIAIES